MDLSEFARRYLEARKDATENDILRAWNLYRNHQAAIAEGRGLLESINTVPEYEYTQAELDNIADIFGISMGGPPAQITVQSVSIAGSEPVGQTDRMALHPRSRIPEAFRLKHQRVKGLHMVIWGRRPYEVVIATFRGKKAAAAMVRSWNAMVGDLGAAEPFSIEAIAAALASTLRDGSGETGAENEFYPPLKGG